MISILSFSQVMCQVRAIEYQTFLLAMFLYVLALFKQFHGVLGSPSRNIPIRLCQCYLGHTHNTLSLKP